MCPNWPIGHVCVKVLIATAITICVTMIKIFREHPKSYIRYNFIDWRKGHNKPICHLCRNGLHSYNNCNPTQHKAVR